MNFRKLGILGVFIAVAGSSCQTTNDGTASLIGGGGIPSSSDIPNPIEAFRNAPVAATTVATVLDTVGKGTSGLEGTAIQAGTRLFVTETVYKNNLSSQAKAAADKTHIALDRSGKLYTEQDDFAATRYISRVARKIASHRAPEAIDLRVFIVKDDQVNAFTSGAGYVYLNRGLITALQNEAQLAMIIGHEAAHIDAGHIVDRAATREKVSLLTEAAENVFKINSEIGKLGLGIGGQLAQTSFSRGNESEADELGLKYVIEAGYDAAEAAKAFQHLADGKGAGASVANLFATHPASANRFATISALASSANAAGGITNGREYRNITASLSLDASRSLRAQGEFAAADEVVGNRLGAGVESVESNLERARVMMARNTGGEENISEAILLFEEAKRLEPQRGETYRELGLAYFERGAVGDKENSINALTSYLQLEPNARDKSQIQNVIELQRL